jgi:hypothetical protein
MISEVQYENKNSKIKITAENRRRITKFSN